MVAVFPYLPGLSWPVMRSIGQFDTSINVAMSGKETRFANRTQPRYIYTLTFDGLDSNGQNPGLSLYTEQTLRGFFIQTLGGALIFNFFDVNDCLATLQEFGVGDGQTTAFQLSRAVGGAADLIFAPLNSGSPVLVPLATGGQGYAPYPAPLIYVNGSLVSNTTYTIGSTGVVTFNSPPTSGYALTWTGNYYWPCNFAADKMDMSEWMAGLWETKKLEIQTRIF
jgi:hypothetical protein